MIKILFKAAVPVLFMFLYSCSSHKSNEIDIFNGITFVLEGGETLAKINLESQEKHESVFICDNINIPLFRHVKGNDYDIFLGIPYGTTLEDLIKNSVCECDSSITDCELLSDTASFRKTYRMDDMYIYQYVVKKAGGSLIYLSAISSSKSIIDTLSLPNRLKQ